MVGTSREQQEWVGGFLFVGNHLALDFLNTKPILEGGPQELLPDAVALGRWLIASGIVTSRNDRALVRRWRNSSKAQALVRELIAFRERLRAAVIRLEAGLLPGNAFLTELNHLLREHPQHGHLGKRGSELILDMWVGLGSPEDAWAPIVAAAASLLSEVEPSRIRKCEAESCVVHFYDTSRKGSRRWCSMNICGNRLKVAAYQRRQRDT